MGACARKGGGVTVAHSHNGAPSATGTAPCGRPSAAAADTTRNLTRNIDSGRLFGRRVRAPSKPAGRRWPGRPAARGRTVGAVAPARSMARAPTRAIERARADPLGGESIAAPSRAHSAPRTLCKCAPGYDGSSHFARPFRPAPTTGTDAAAACAHRRRGWSDGAAHLLLPALPAAGG